MEDYLNSVENNNNNNINSNRAYISGATQSDRITNTQNMNYIQQILSEIEKNENSYFCIICNTFPLIKIIDGKTILVRCEDEEDDKKSFEKMFKYKIKPIKEEAIKYLLCNENGHNNIYQCYCLKCDKNLCEKCYYNCLNDPEHDQNKDFKRFNILDKDIKYKEDFIKNIFEKNKKNELDKKNIVKNNKPLTHLEGNIIKIDINDKDRKIASKIEDDTENFLDLENIEKLFKVIIYSKEQFPNYTHYLNIENIYYYFCDKLDIEYYSYLDQSERDIQIFGKKFVENNKNNCYLIINNKREDLKEKWEIKEDEKLEITLVKDKPITDMSEMFYNCDTLSYIKVNSQWTMDNVTDMHSMFYGCISLNDIGELFADCNTSKVNDFSYMFYKCECLRNIKHINNFDTSNATNLSYMFNGCLTLLECDLSKWNTKEVNYMNYMFADCESLKELIGLDKWDTNRVTYMNNMFENCSNLVKFSNISNWNIKNVVDRSEMFDGFSTLVKKPDWAKEKVDDEDD